MTRLFALLTILMPAVAGADGRWPGGVAIIDLGPAGDQIPVVEYAGERVLIMRNQGRWRAAIGISLDAEPGRATIRLGTDVVLSFDIGEHAYREQRLNVDRKYVALSDEALERIRAERKIIDAALTNWRDTDFDSIDLKAPVDGPRSSSFGLRRYFNDEPRAPHKGMDIAAAEGTPVTAPRAGIGTATGDFYFNGNTIFLDHGQGYVTMYCHLSEIDVDAGQVITVGTTIGNVGKTGRVTGPHLHFGTYLNGTAVDPSMLLVTD